MASVVSVTHVTAAPSSSVNLLDWDDDVPAAKSTQPAASNVPQLYLQPNFELTPQRYQQLWTSLPDVYNGKLCRLQSLPSQQSDIESSLRPVNVRKLSHMLQFSCIILLT
jgi:hypothetical protein